MKPDPQSWAKQADVIIEEAMLDIQDQGIPDVLMLDRLGTFFAIHMVQAVGNDGTAHILRRMADSIEAGTLDTHTGEGQTRN